MKIGMLGLGKLGLPVALAIESKGHEVYGYDVNAAPYTYLANREIPYREEGLQPLLDVNGIELMKSVDDLVAAADLIFVPVQTPHDQRFGGDRILDSDDRTDFDYTYLNRAIEDVSRCCDDLKKPKIVAVISTCLPGTYQREIKPRLSEYVEYVYTPQFIAMGTVLKDYLYPEFNLIGVESLNAACTLREFYLTINEAPAIKTDITTAEGIKVSYNTWITAKTVIANAWGELSERLGMDFDAIKQAWDLSEKRIIAPAYMNAGMSDGGGCHPRDNIAMSWLAEKSGMSHNVWEDLMQARESYENWHATVALNESTKHNLPLVLLGRAFKPGTDIESGSPALLMADILSRTGVDFRHVTKLSNGLGTACYFVATQDPEYARYVWPSGSVVIDPFGYIADQPGVTIKRLGRK